MRFILLLIIWPECGFGFIINFMPNGGRFLSLFIHRWNIKSTHYTHFTWHLCLRDVVSIELWCLCALLFRPGASFWNSIYCYENVTFRLPNVIKYALSSVVSLCLWGQCIELTHAGQVVRIIDKTPVNGPEYCYVICGCLKRDVMSWLQPYLALWLLLRNLFLFARFSALLWFIRNFTQRQLLFHVFLFMSDINVCRSLL